MQLISPDYSRDDYIDGASALSELKSDQFRFTDCLSATCRKPLATPPLSPSLSPAVTPQLFFLHRRLRLPSHNVPTTIPYVQT